MAKLIGFDNDKYLSQQTEAILERGRIRPGVTSIPKTAGQGVRSVGEKQCFSKSIAGHW